MPSGLADGDANEILRHVQRQFDFVYASRCLEHMRGPRAAIAQWRELVKPGGVLFVIVPDEDLYERGSGPAASIATTSAPSRAPSTPAGRRCR